MNWHRLTPNDTLTQTRGGTRYVVRIIRRCLGLSINKRTKLGLRPCFCLAAWLNAQNRMCSVHKAPLINQFTLPCYAITTCSTSALRLHFQIPAAKRVAGWTTIYVYCMSNWTIGHPVGRPAPLCPDSMPADSLHVSSRQAAEICPLPLVHGLHITIVTLRNNNAPTDRSLTCATHVYMRQIRRSIIKNDKTEALGD